MTAGTLELRLHQRGVAELLDAYARAATDPVAVVDDALDALASAERESCGVVTVVGERARREAERSAERWAHGTARPLEGIPFGVKDNLATADVLTTLGSARWADWVPQEDAAAVRRLRDAGAVLLAKLATPELAFGDARPGHRPQNPWSREHWTGGSSSGPGVALAARLLPLALGSDTGGSIRVPSSYCGVTGLKPTRGSVPTAGVATVSWTLDHVGPMARSAIDAGLALDVLRDRAGSRPKGAAGVRVGLPVGWFDEAADDDVLAAAAAAAEVLRGLGATTAPVSVPDPALGGIAAWVLTVAEFAEANHDWRDHVQEYTPAAAERLAAGAALGAGDYLRARRVRRDLCARTDEVLQDVDVLLTPATPTAAPRIVPPLEDLWSDGDRMWLERVARNLILFNLLGLPSVVVPSGLTGDGRPLAVQFVGRAGEDDLVLAVAAAFQGATAHHLAAPQRSTAATGPSISDAEKGGRPEGPLGRT